MKTLSAKAYHESASVPIRNTAAGRKRLKELTAFKRRAFDTYGPSARISGQYANGHPEWVLDLGKLSMPVIEAATQDDCFAIATAWIARDLGEPHARARLRTAMAKGKAILHEPKCDGSGTNHDGREWSRRFVKGEVS